MTDLALAADLLSAEQASSLTAQIRAGVDRLGTMILRAYTGRADLALGYTSWDDYCDAELDTPWLRIPREERQGFVQSLSESGMSQRAIAAVSGVSQSTVRRELSGESNDSPDTEESSDNDEEAESQPEPDDFFADLSGPTSEPSSLPPPEPEPEPEPERRVTGLDGKSYPAKKPPKEPKRNPLVPRVKTAGWTLRRAADALDELAEDDRFTSHRAEIARDIADHLTFTIQTCQAILNRLEN